MSRRQLSEVNFRIAMARRGLRHVGDVGPLAGVSPSYARLMMCGTVPSARVREAVARALGASVDDLWPVQVQVAS